jgi:hypothetical protein
MPIIQISEEYRWLSAPLAPFRYLHESLLYVTQHPDREERDVASHFSRMALIADLTRARRGAPVDKFYVFSLSGFHGPALGRMP